MACSPPNYESNQIRLALIPTHTRWAPAMSATGGGRAQGGARRWIMIAGLGVVAAAGAYALWRHLVGGQKRGGSPGKARGKDTARGGETTGRANEGSANEDAPEGRVGDGNSTSSSEAVAGEGQPGLADAPGPSLVTEEEEKEGGAPPLDVCGAAAGDPSMTPSDPRFRHSTRGENPVRVRETPWETRVDRALAKEATAGQKARRSLDMPAVVRLPPLSEGG